MLGSKGVDLPKIIQKLESISTKRTFESVEPVADVNTVGILEREIQNCILTVFEQGFNKVVFFNGTKTCLTCYLPFSV